MNVRVTEGQATVDWNDRDDRQSIQIAGCMWVTDEKTLRDTHSALDLLFGK